MRKVKVYRTRRGMRFSSGGRGKSPAAGFVGGPAITRTRPTTSKVNNALKKTDSVGFSGAAMPSLKGPDGSYADPTDPAVLTSSLYLAGSISMGRLYERKKLNATILGLPRSSVDISPWPSETVMELTTTGSFDSPSWTHASVGFNQGFVGVSLTSSFETNSLNYFKSGTQAVESSPVPASASLFYAKSVRLQTIIVKHTGSFFDTVVTGTGSFPSSFSSLTGVNCSQVTGTGLALCVNSTFNPATFSISVPVSGKLVDIKVWVEFVHLSGGPGRYQPLAVMALALRSPNVSWGHAHPIYNDATFQLQSQISSNSAETFYRDSFLLWEGMGQGPQGGGGSAPNANNDGHSGYNSQKYPTWGRDRSMRTVFSDGAAVPNPRHHYSPVMAANFNGAPNAAESLAQNVASGNDVPWTSDKTVFPATESYQAVGSPPTGWLTAPGGIASANEWPTSGSNLGTNQIKPVYPLLDAIYIRKIVGDERAMGGGVIPVPPPTPALWTGFRPGLRGSEISGTWQLMVASNFNGLATTDSVDLYFRQFRLEITYETPTSAEPALPRKQTKHKPRRANRETFLYAISGSANSNVGTGAGAGYDWFRTFVYSTSPSDGEIGRTFGLTMNTGSFSSDYALLYRLSGVLGNIFGPTPDWLTNNQFGMPAIPNSSASLVPSGATTAVASADFFFPAKILDGARRLTDVATDLNPPRTLIQLASAFVSASLS